MSSDTAMTIPDAIACDIFVDISGCDCTQPSSKLNDAIEVLRPGQSLLAVSKKHALLNDIPAFCHQRELLLSEQGESGDTVYFLIRIG
jgi:TusA-related sulfurtransferase